MGKIPLQWQVEAAERVRDENLIVFAETGAGKTLVAELAIKDALQREPSKRCAFLVTTTRLLAHQQWDRLLRSLREDTWPLVERDGVVEVTGYTTSEWDESAWSNCCERAKVLVGTIETFARAVIDHGYLQLSDFSLVVVDEAHKACGDSPGVELLHRIADAAAPPRVLGLTASYANDGAKTWEEFQDSRRSLEAIFRAKLHVCTVPPRKKPRFERIEYAPSRDALEAKSAANLVCQCLWRELRRNALKEPKEAQRLTQQLAELLTELGREAFDIGVQEGLLAQMEGRIDTYSKMVDLKPLAERHQADLKQLKTSLRAAAKSVEDSDPLRSFPARSEKLKALVEYLQEEFYGDGKDDGSVGMVFVSQVALAMPLAKLLSRQLRGVSVGVVSGVNSMTEEKRNSAFSDFRTGRTQLLVCTQCAEEGLDVAECSFVVRFNQFSTTRSHVQGVGRARAEEARVYYFDNCPNLECHLAEVMQAVAREPLEVPAVPNLPSYCQRSPVHPFKVLGGMAEVNFRSAQRIWARYVSVISGGEESFKDLQCPGGLLVPGPNGGLKLMEADVRRFMAPHPDVDNKTLMKYVAVLALHLRGWLDKYNCVPKEVVAQSTIWQKSIGAADEFQCLDLHFMVSRRHRQLHSGGHRDRKEKSHTEQVDLGQMRLKPEDVVNTQLTVNTTFSNGGSVLAAMKHLVTGSQRIEDFPPIRVAWSESGHRWYSADNRRLFIYKVVAPLMDLETIEVNVINWTSEFSAKRNQIERFGKVWATHEKSVSLVRHQLLEAMARDDFGAPQEELKLDPEEEERSSSLLRQLPVDPPLDEPQPEEDLRSEHGSVDHDRKSQSDEEDQVDDDENPSEAASEAASTATEEAWEVLEDYEICETTVGGPGSERLRVELVLEPDHATSCQRFQPKQQLMEHLCNILGRAPTLSECRFAFKGWGRFWRCRVELQIPGAANGSFEGTPAETHEQAEQNAAWRVLEKLKLIKVVDLHRTETLREALRTLPNSENLELVQDGCVVSADVQLWQLRCLRFEVRDAEPW